MMEITEANVIVAFTEQILGTAPLDKDIYEKYIKSKKPVVQIPTPIEIPEGEDETDGVVPNEDEKGMTGFLKDENGLYVMNYFIKGYFKHAGNTFREMINIKAMKSKLDDFFFVAPRKVYFLRNRQFITEPDGILERPINISGPQGKRTAIARSEFLNPGVALEFSVKLLKHKEITIRTIEDLLEYGTLHGMGQFRNGGYGCFEVIEFIEL